MRVRFVTFVAIFAATPTWSCLFPSKKSSSGGPPAPSTALIDKDSFVIDRIGEGTSARLTFKTTKAAVCDLAFYTQDATVPPTKDLPTQIPCSAQDQPRTEFTERLTGLRGDVLYFVVVRAHEPNVDKTHSEEVVVKESRGPVASSGQPAAGNSGGAGSPTTPSANGSYKSLYLARLDIPLMTAEFFRTNLESPQDGAAIKGNLSRKLGCVAGPFPDQGAYRRAEPDFQLTNLATRDLGAASARPHPDYPERLLATYKGLSPGTETWTLLYQTGGKDVLVPIRSVATFANVEMESATTLAFDRPNLAAAPDPLKIDTNKPLKFSWTVSTTLPEFAYVALQIGRPDYAKAISCLYPASQRLGIVDAGLVQGLDPGNHLVTAELSITQFWAKDGWIVGTSDWRTSKIAR